MIGCCAALLLPRELLLHRSQVLLEFYKLRRGLHALRNSPLEGGQGGVAEQREERNAVLKKFKHRACVWDAGLAQDNTPLTPLKGEWLGACVCAALLLLRELLLHRSQVLLE